MKTISIKWSLFFIILISFSCSKVDEPEIEEKQQQIAPKNNYHLPNSVYQYTKITSEDSVIMKSNVLFVKNDINQNLIENNLDYLIFKATGFQDSIKVGNILYSVDVVSEDKIYARKILSKEIFDGKVKFTTEQAILPDIYQVLNEKINLLPDNNLENFSYYDIDSIKLDYDEVSSSYVISDNALNSQTKFRSSPLFDLSSSFKITNPNSRIKNISFKENKLSFEYILFDYDEKYSTTNDQLIVKLLISYNKNSYINPCLKGNTFQVNGGLYYDSELSFNYNYSVIKDSVISNRIKERFKQEMFQNKIPLLSLPLIPPSAVSLAIKPSMDLFVVLNLDLKGQLEIGFVAEHVGFNYRFQHTLLGPTTSVH